MLEDQSIHDIASIYEQCSTCMRSNARNPETCADPCFSLVKHALTDKDQPWTYFYLAFEPWMTGRVRASCFRYRVADDQVSHFVNIAYMRCWKYLQGKPEKLRDFNHALNYLRTCARSTVLDSIKHLPPILDEEPDDDRTGNATDEYDNEFETLWQMVMDEIRDDKDRLLVDCYILQSLKPQDILEAFPETWQTAEEIKVAWQRIRRQLRRNYAIRRWFDIDDTI